jgi:hypothetical protein
MTEAEWQSCTDPTPMLAFLGGKASGRKLRLFACACCQPITDLFPIPAYRELIESAERFADGGVSKRQLGDRYRAVAQHSNSLLAMTVCGVSDPTASYAAKKTARRLHELAPAAGLQRSALSQSQACLLRDLFGSPFRPIAPQPSWQTPNAVTLASTIYDERRWELLPLLADLLEEAGCPVEVSEHCRGPGPHVRGCWVVDLVRSVD